MLLVLIFLDTSIYFIIH